MKICIKSTLMYVVSKLLICISIFALGLQAGARQCRYLFETHEASYAFGINDKLIRFTRAELFELSPQELSTLRKEVLQQKDRIETVRQLKSVKDRLDLYSQMSGSDRYHVIVEEARRIRKDRNDLKRGSVQKVVDRLESDFVTFEVNYLYVKSLMSRIEYLQENPIENRKEIKKNISELTAAEKYLGKNFYRYAAIRTMLDEVLNSKLTEQHVYADEALTRLQKAAAIQATNQILIYKATSFEEVKHHLAVSDVARSAMLHKAALGEFFTMVKMLTLSGPFMKVIRGLVHSLPSNLRLVGIPSISPREFISSAVNLSYNEHRRDLYLEKVEDILSLDGYPDRQYELMKTLNSTSEKKDGLLVFFAQVPENELTWTAIRKYADSVVDRSAMAKNFSERLAAAEKKAINDGEVALYTDEAGASVASKLIAGGLAAYYVTMKYLSENPEALDGVFDVVHTVLTVMGLGF